MKLYEEIENCFPMIEKQFKNEDLLYFKNSLVIDLSLYHFGLCTWIRNELLYPKGNILYSLFLENGIKEEDDMSSMIILLFHYYLSTSN
jgi:hypothetical protein